MYGDRTYLPQVGRPLPVEGAWLLVTVGVIIQTAPAPGEDMANPST